MNALTVGATEMTGVGMRMGWGQMLWDGVVTGRSSVGWGGEGDKRLGVG